MATVALIVGSLAAAGASAPVLAAAPVPRVALIVGPVGDLTSTYRHLANGAAAEAQAAGAEVIKVYSPNATWSAVRDATEGASIVVYLGHGNGWPSPYRDSLYPPSQNGFGLNPVAGADDVAHQYFGEAYVQKLHLASNAVIVLSHLCYASGNSEPGLAEGTESMAIQRVDNFAAGFISAGAKAVIAEAHDSPAYYVRALLRSKLGVEQIWQRAPSAHGHTFAVASTRSPGFTERLDPDRPSGGYYRSLVSRGVTAGQVRSGATGSTSGVVAQPPSEPSLVTSGVRFGNLALAALPIAATSTQLTLPVTGNRAKQIPDGAEISVRWDPLLLAPVPSTTSDPSASPGPEASPTPGPTPTPSPSSSPDPTLSPTPTASPSAPPEPPQVDLVAPEQVGTVVTATRVSRTKKGLSLAVTYPSAPGLYRLVATLHTPSGVAYDAATQALLTPALVQVGGPVAVAYGAPASLSLDTAASTTVAIRVVNAGSKAWDLETGVPPTGPAEELLSWLRTSRDPARLVATWVSAAGDPVPDPAVAVLDPAVSVPGGDTVATLGLVAPSNPGDYLLLLDVVSPALGSLSAHGSTPALIRVTVTGAPVAPSPSPSAPGASPSGSPAASGLSGQPGAGASPSTDPAGAAPNG